MDKISVAPNYTYFLPTDLGNSVSFSTASLNLDARFYISEMIYAMAGYASYSNKISGGGSNVTVSEGALNVGAGALIPASDALGINVQVKYQSILDSNIDFNQIVGQVGAVFLF